MRLGSRLAMLHAALAAALAAGGASAFLASARRALDAEMTARSLAVARMVRLSIDPAWVDAIAAGAIPARELATDALAAATSAGDARRAVLLDEKGDVLAA